MGSPMLLRRLKNDYGCRGVVEMESRKIRIMSTYSTHLLVHAHAVGD